MTIEQWRANDELVAWAHNMMLTPQWQTLMGMMMDLEHPMHRGLYEDLKAQDRGMTEFDHSKALGIIMGWNQFAMKLRLAALPRNPQTVVRETWEPPEVEVETPAEKASVKRRKR